MHVVGAEFRQTQYADMEMTLKMYLNVSEMHEWKSLKMEDFVQRVERAITREFSKPVKERHRVLIERE